MLLPIEEEVIRWSSGSEWCCEVLVAKCAVDQLKPGHASVVEIGASEDR